MTEVRILTDIAISQSALWTERTELIGPTGDDTGFSLIRSLFISLGRLVKTLTQLTKFDVVVTAQPKTTYLIGCFRRIFRIRHPRHIVLELMLDEQQHTLYWRVKRAIQEYLFSSVDLVCVSSTQEIATYSERLKKPREQFRFIPFHTNVLEPKATGKGSYILSAGRSGRDYGVLAAAVKDLDVEAVIISDKRSVEGIVFPPNTTVIVDVPLRRYYDLLNNCRFVVIPLKTLAKSTGQVVLLDAMATGKPVIATDTIGTRDYIRPGVNGILVSPADAISLRTAIKSLLESQELEERLSASGLESARAHHTLDGYVRSILRAAEGCARAAMAGDAVSRGPHRT